MTDRKTVDSTDAVHAGEARRKSYDAVPMPLVQTSTYTFADTAEIAAFTAGSHPDAERGEYGRYGNPTVRAVEQRLAALEGTDDAVLFGSGMAAVTTGLLALVRGGQHVVLFRDCYRMTLEFVTDVLARFGVAHTLLDAGDVAVLPAALRPETRLVLSESPTNPNLRLLVKDECLVGAEGINVEGVEPGVFLSLIRKRIPISNHRHVLLSQPKKIACWLMQQWCHRQPV